MFTSFFSPLVCPNFRSFLLLRMLDFLGFMAIDNIQFFSLILSKFKILSVSSLLLKCNTKQLFCVVNKFGIVFGIRQNNPVRLLGPSFPSRSPETLNLNDLPTGSGSLILVTLRKFDGSSSFVGRFSATSSSSLIVSI